MENCISIQHRIISGNSLNGHNTLFGGAALEWMDEAAYILAIRLTRQKMVTAKVDKVRFMAPVYAGSIAEIKCEAIKICSLCMEIKVEIFAEEMYSNERYKAIEAYFLFAAIKN